MTIVLILQAYEKIAYLLTNLGKSIFLHSLVKEHFIWEYQSVVALCTLVFLISTLAT